VKRVPPSKVTKARIEDLLANGVGEESPLSELVRLSVEHIVEEALEAKVEELLGRGYYQRCAEGGYGDRGVGDRGVRRSRCPGDRGVGDRVRRSRCPIEVSPIEVSVRSRCQGRVGTDRGVRRSRCQGRVGTPIEMSRTDILRDSVARIRPCGYGA